MPPSGWTRPWAMSSPPSKPNRARTSSAWVIDRPPWSRTAPSARVSSCGGASSLAAAVSSSASSTFCAARWTARPATVVDRLAPGGPADGGDLGSGPRTTTSATGARSTPAPVLGLTGPAPLTTSLGAGRARVGVAAVGFHRHRLPAVRAGGGVAGRGGNPGPVVRVRAGVQPGPALPAEQGPVGRGGGAHPGGHVVPPGGDHRLVHRVEDPHRAAGLAGDGRGQRLHLGVGLAAEAAAEERHDDPDLVDRQPEQHGDLLADQERVLAGGPHGQLAALPV